MAEAMSDTTDIAEKIGIEDLRDLKIIKKFVSINSSRYTDEAYQYIRSLVDDEHAILFDADTNRIWTLGQFYGGDTLKENLHYWNSVLSINLDGSTIDEIICSANDSALKILPRDGVSIQFLDGSTISIGYDLKSRVDQTPVKFKDGNEYYISMSSDSVIGLGEYSYPGIEIDLKYLDATEKDENNKIEKTIKFRTTGDVDFSNWTDFNVISLDAIVKSINASKREFTVEFEAGVDCTLQVTCNDGIHETHQLIEISFCDKYRYGLYDEIEFVESGIDWIALSDGHFSVDLDIDQEDWRLMKHAYVMIPHSYNILFFDRENRIQGAWHRIDNMTIDDVVYAVWITDNYGLGLMKWGIEITID